MQAADEPAPDLAAQPDSAPAGDGADGPDAAIVPEARGPDVPAGLSPEEPVRCGRWKLKPFELPRPVLLRAGGPLSLREFLAHPDPTVLDELNALDPEQQQTLVLARLAGAPLEMRLSLFGKPGYTMRDVVRHVQEGTPLGVRVIDAERKLVGLLLTEALQ
jgi:hypothetical protein